ncbi:hypothetical protein Cme02nite_14200 [Catellatospora methionotrophica]|uniref:ABC transporter domain-containing protein n=1 Tax=Catellatospora methionotrophica TaxID=121620 RepID=A0A8J3L2C0_9ACTN|nr:ABC transporter ATP-binding protein [Catellatospora methionotrophica]GIG13088.1 hypothetical protein Cme02nite_14200 [Catellatospora methionotrophica]
MPVVVARDLSVQLGGGTVLDRVHLTADPGQIVAVQGVNGCGKSTLLRCLSGLLRPGSGEVEVLGGPPSGDPAFWRQVGLLAEEPAWYPGLTVREHLALVALTHGVTTPVDRALADFELTARAAASPLALSAGQRQRLALAATMARPSRLLLLDEPEQKLDAGFRDRLAAMLRAYAHAGGTVVLATHDAALVAAMDATALWMRDGRLTRTGPVPA